MGCFTPAKENEFKTDIFNLQTRMLKIEQSAKDAEGDSKQTRKSSSQRLGAVQSEVEKFDLELQRLKGEMDALKVGVQTGQMPGTSDEEESVAQKLAGLQSRIESIESTQVEILTLLENKSSGGGADAKKDQKIETLADMRAAYNQRRYLHVADVAEEILKKQTKDASKEEGLFLYADSLYKLGRLRDAALKFNDFIEAYGNSSKIAQAKLRVGDSFRHLGDADTAKIYYEELVAKYPKTEQAQTAKERLERFEKRGAAQAVGTRKRG
jgi:TolA-binding protein